MSPSGSVRVLDNCHALKPANVGLALEFNQAVKFLSDIQIGEDPIVGE